MFLWTDEKMGRLIAFNRSYDLLAIKSMIFLAGKIFLLPMNYFLPAAQPWIGEPDKYLITTPLFVVAFSIPTFI